MSARSEDLVSETEHYARGLFRVAETRYLVNGWDTERGVELWYGNGEDIDARILLGVRWSAADGWQMSTDDRTRLVSVPTDHAPMLADALEALARVVRTL